MATQKYVDYVDAVNHHSGQYVAYKSEQGGGCVEQHGRWFRITNPRGECLEVPDRGLEKSEWRHIRMLLRLMGITICLGALGYFASLVQTALAALP